VSPKRKDRVAPPPVGDEWDVKFGTNEAAKGWIDLCAQAATNTRAAFELMRSNPRPPEDRRRTRLRDELGIRIFDGRALEQWEIEVTGGGPVRCLPHLVGSRSLR
jgi:hypothetical protein